MCRSPSAVDVACPDSLSGRKVALCPHESWLPFPSGVLAAPQLVLWAFNSPMCTSFRAVSFLSAEGWKALDSGMGDTGEFLWTQCWWGLKLLITSDVLQLACSLWAVLAGRADMLLVLAVLCSCFKDSLL